MLLQKCLTFNLGSLGNQTRIHSSYKPVVYQIFIFPIKNIAFTIYLLQHDRMVYHSHNSQREYFTNGLILYLYISYILFLLGKIFSIRFLANFIHTEVYNRSSLRYHFSNTLFARSYFMRSTWEMDQFHIIIFNRNLMHIVTQ